MSPEYAAEWARKAEADKTAAEVCLRISRRMKDQADIACFHAQQCVEKYLKAVLASLGHATPRIHDLERLADLVERAVSAALSRRDLERINSYAVEIRYPGATATRGEALKAVAAMHRLRRSCLRLLKSTNQAARADQSLRAAR